jgi:hypothetical protein
MKKDIRSLLAVLASAALLSGCGPASIGPASSGPASSGPSPAVSAAQSRPGSADTAQEPAPTVGRPAPVIPARPTATTSTHPAEDTALAAVARLTVKGRAPKTGYTRAQFGQTWFDTDHNGCDTRNDVLRRDLHDRQMKNACKVLAGTLAPDPYTGASIRFVYGGASEVDIDHLVALSDAWQKGAAGWPAGKRLALANDPLNLVAVDASANRSKSDGDTATWLPPNKAYRCTYVAGQVAVKVKYGLWVTSAERDAMTRVLAACPTLRLPGPGSALVLAAVPRAADTPVAKPVPSAVLPAGGATALCRDGTYSFAAHHQGACSGHGGVKVFYR